MQEIWWSGTIAVLDKTSYEGTILPAEKYNSWIDLPITVWNNGNPAGVIRNIHLLEDRIDASGTVSEGSLLGLLVRGKSVYVSPNIKFAPEKNLITGLTVVHKAVWEAAKIRTRYS